MPNHLNLLARALCCAVSLLALAAQATVAQQSPAAHQPAAAEKSAAAERSAAAGQAAAAQPASKSFLWQIKSKQNTVYLLGSIHLLKKEDYPLNPAIEKAYSDSQGVVLETELDERAQAAIQKLALEKGVFADGTTLEQAISPAAYELTKKRVEELGLSIDFFSRLKPWLVSLSISVLKLQRLGFDPQYGIDLYFMNKARQDKKELSGLESGEYQINRFADMPAKMQEESLITAMNDLAVMEKRLGEIVAAWHKGDTASVDELMISPMRKTSPEVYERLLAERNRNWLPLIEKYLASDKHYLIIVGAGHLVGSDGLIKALTDKGYTIEQQ